MKFTFTERACGAAVLSIALFLSSAARSRAAGQPDLTFFLTLNVASLVSDINGPFSLDLQLAPGSDNIVNTVTLTNFTFTGGSATGSPNFTAGGATGSLTSTVTLTNSSPIDNELAQAFSSGVTQIQFHVDQTVNPETGVNAVPDQFNVFIDDNNSATGFFVPTTDPTGNDTLLSSTIIEGESLGDLNTYSSTSPDAGVTASVSTVPEPTSAAMLLIVGAFGLCARWRTFRRS
jgi:hypothetical protein